LLFPVTCRNIAGNPESARRYRNENPLMTEVIRNAADLEIKEQ